MLQAPEETGLASGTPALLRLCAALADGHGGRWDTAPARSLHPAHQRLWPWGLSHPCLLALCHSPPVKLPFSLIFQAPPSPHLLGLPSARQWGLAEMGTKSRVVASTPGWREAGPDPPGLSCLWPLKHPTCFSSLSHAVHAVYMPFTCLEPPCLNSLPTPVCLPRLAEVLSPLPPNPEGSSRPFPPQSNSPLRPEHRLAAGAQA